ncbi:MAG: cyclophilin-like domain-containing protein [Monoraphidium minutum]|nr:MAG: cyclophilin-like domain-containing protein [Monoraphidium minutum]
MHMVSHISCSFYPGTREAGRAKTNSIRHNAGRQQGGIAIMQLLHMALLLAAAGSVCSEPAPLAGLSRERAVFQTKYGDITFGFLPDVAPVTAQHIFRLVTLGAYNGNHIFRVDKGFVAQVAEVTSGRFADAPLDAAQKAEGVKKVPLEVRPSVKHTAGVLSMGRFDDPDSGTSSFSMLLGAAPHLDNQYTIFGQITSGMDVLRKLETLETRREGIFVMPKERITIVSSYWYINGAPLSLMALAAPAVAGPGAAAVKGVVAATNESNPGGTVGLGSNYCDHLQDELDKLRSTFNWQAEELQRVRLKCLPGH